MKEDVLELIMGSEEAAEKWGITKRQAAYLCEQGEVRSKKINGSWIIPISETYRRRRRSKK